MRINVKVKPDHGRLSLHVQVKLPQAINREYGYAGTICCTTQPKQIKRLTERLNQLPNVPSLATGKMDYYAFEAQAQPGPKRAIAFRSAHYPITLIVRQKGPTTHDDFSTLYDILTKEET